MYYSISEQTYLVNELVRRSVRRARISVLSPCNVGHVGRPPLLFDPLLKQLQRKGVTLTSLHHRLTLPPTPCNSTTSTLCRTRPFATYSSRIPKFPILFHLGAYGVDSYFSPHSHDFRIHVPSSYSATLYLNLCLCFFIHLVRTPCKEFCPLACPTN